MVAQRKHKVLLIDDSEISLQFAAALLVEAGYEVRTADNVDDFDETLGDWAPDIILTDVQMPGLSGPELCRLLKARYDTAHVPVVLYSSLSDEQLAELAPTCEADGYVSNAPGPARLPPGQNLLIW